MWPGRLVLFALCHGCDPQRSQLIHWISVSLFLIRFTSSSSDRLVSCFFECFSLVGPHFKLTPLHFLPSQQDFDWNFSQQPKTSTLCDIISYSWFSWFILITHAFVLIIFFILKTYLNLNSGNKTDSLLTGLFLPDLCQFPEPSGVVTPSASSSFTSALTGITVRLLRRSAAKSVSMLVFGKCKWLDERKHWSCILTGPLHSRGSQHVLSQLWLCLRNPTQAVWMTTHLLLWHLSLWKSLSAWYVTISLVLS